MVIHSKAPNRVDLAGGTLDIYPLYLFEEGGLTLNLAIKLYSIAEVEPLQEKSVTLLSKDLDQTVEAPSVESVPLGGNLDLLARIVRFYKPESGVRITTYNEAPQGSGVGASSSLLIALSGALNSLLGNPHSPHDLMEYGAQLEAQTLRIPTGKQDYLAALHGGLNAIWFDLPGIRVEPLKLSPKFLQELESSLLLSFTGIPHFSGANNWSIMRGYIEGEGSTVASLRAIKETALQMYEALQAENLEKFASLLHQEWENRKRLSPGVTTPQVEQMMAGAREEGALASKLCGAGGGGCMITVAPPARKKKVETALEREGARSIPLAIAHQGLQVTQLEASSLKG